MSEVFIQAIWLSLDPYQRGRMRVRPSHAAPLELGEVITGGVIGRVTVSIRLESVPTVRMRTITKIIKGGNRHGNTA